MEIIDLVNCSNTNNLKSIALFYLSKDPNKEIITDSPVIRDMLEEKFSVPCVYCESIINMLVQANERSLLLLTERHNTSSQVFKDILKNHTVLVCND